MVQLFIGHYARIAAALARKFVRRRIAVLNQIPTGVRDGPADGSVLYHSRRRLASEKRWTLARLGKCAAMRSQVFRKGLVVNGRQGERGTAPPLEIAHPSTAHYGSRSVESSALPQDD